MDRKEESFKDKKLLGESTSSADTTPYALPKGWEWRRLKEVAKFKSGYAFKSKDFVEQGIQLIRMGNLYKNELRLDRNPVYLPFDYDENIVEKYTIHNGEILLSLTGTKYKRDYGFAVKVTGLHRPILLNQRILSLKPDIVTSYVYYYLQTVTFRDAFFGFETGGVNQGNVGSKAVESILIPVPSLDKQKRIAEKVERLLGKIEEAKQFIEEAKETFELRRAAILDKAFRGELTRNWREENPSLESALIRLDRMKTERFLVADTKREVSEITQMFEELDTKECINDDGWLYLKANMICYNINCGGTPSNDISDEGEVPFLKVYNIVNNKVAFLYKPQYISKEVHESKLKKSILKPNDVIMNIVGPPLKKIAIIPGEYPEMNMNQAIVRFRPIKYVLPKYLYYCLQYDETLREVISETRGVVGQSNISVSQSRNLVIPVPSLEEQAMIVKLLEESLEREETALNLISDKKNFEELSQSILSKAFRGELGTNDPSEENVIELLKEVLQEQVK